MKPIAVLLALMAAGTGAASPAELLTPNVPAGFEVAVDPPTDLTFEEYAPLSPDAIAHVDPASAAAAGMIAAVDVWTAVDNDILLREITRWRSAAEARAFTEQAIVTGVESGLTAGASPFEGGIAYGGENDKLWTRTITWSQGRYGITIAHFSIEEGTDEIIDTAATAQATAITAATGDVVAGAVDGTAADGAASTSASAFTLVTILLWIVILAGGIALFLRLRHRRRDSAEHFVDDTIERARSRSRTSRDLDTDDPN